MTEDEYRRKKLMLALMNKKGRVIVGEARFTMIVSATSAPVPQQTEPEVIKEDPLPERGIIL